MIKEFKEKLMEHINKTMNVYYEEAPSDATFPYGVIPTLSISDLTYGFQCLFDIEVYASELSDIDADSLIDSLRDALSGYCFRNTNVGFYVSFDNEYLNRFNDQDFVERRISFIARIF